MKNEVVIIDPKEFGIEEKSAKSIELAFAPSISERNELSEKFDLLIKKEITPELIDEIVVLDKQLQKCEKSIFNTHKSQKSYSLALGRLIDAWKNKETDPIKQMREKCKETKNHFDNIEKERIHKIEEQRISELEKLEVEEIPAEIGHMPESIYKSFLAGSKISFQEKKAEAEKEEKERIEKQKKLDLYNERYKEMLPYSDFLDISRLSIETSFEEYSNTLNLAIKAKEHSEKKAKEQAIENERLKKEAKEREEKERKSNELREKRTKDLQPYIVFIRDYNGLISKPEKEYQKEFTDIKKGAEEQWKFDREEEAKKVKEKEEADALLEKERLKNKETQDKLDAIEKEKADDLEREKSKGDKEHIEDLINALKDIKDQYESKFKSKKNLVMFANVQGLIDKTIVFIKK